MKGSKPGEFELKYIYHLLRYKDNPEKHNQIKKEQETQEKAMIEGICPQCKVHYHGEALGTKSNQLCIKCGSALEIRNNGVQVSTALSPSKYEEYHINADQEEWEDLCTKNLLIYFVLN